MGGLVLVLDLISLDKESQNKITKIFKTQPYLAKSSACTRPPMLVLVHYL